MSSGLERSRNLVDLVEQLPMSLLLPGDTAQRLPCNSRRSLAVGCSPTVCASSDMPRLQRRRPVALGLAELADGPLDLRETLLCPASGENRCDALQHGQGIAMSISGGPPPRTERLHNRLLPPFRGGLSPVVRGLMPPLAHRLQRVRPGQPAGDCSRHGRGEHDRAHENSPRPARVAAAAPARRPAVRRRRRTSASQAGRCRAGRMKLPMNRCDLCARALRISQPVAQLPDVFVDRRRDPHTTAVLGQQVVEVNRAFLRACKLLGQHREHRPADDRRLDHRARIDADDRRRVIDRVEEIGAVVRVDRIVAAPRKEDRARQVRQADPDPRRGSCMDAAARER